MGVMLTISIALIAGIIGGKIAERLTLPKVSGYLVAGVLIGPSIFKIFESYFEVVKYDIISELALSIIAFSIGSEFIYREIKKLGKKIVIITLMEVIGAVLLVFFFMYVVCKQDLAFSLVIASMSAATAPAATFLVMQQYRAYGPLTKTILPVVALDDIYGIMTFGILSSVAMILKSPTPLSVKEMVLGPTIEIFGSLLVGITIGIVLTIVIRLMKRKTGIQPIALAAILLGAGIAKVINASPLLVNIAVGTIVANIVPDHEKVFKSISDLSEPIYVLFFTLAGAKLELYILKYVGIVGIVYIFARGFGKYLGAFIGAQMVNAEPTVKKYLGLALLPQGGISIGLLVIVSQKFAYDPQFVSWMTTIIMFSILFYETGGPIFSKIAISKAGEINGLDKLENSDLNLSTN